MIHVDFLIIGQGIAGSLLAYRLTKAGKTVLILDKDLSSSASIASAGIINPVTGRKFVKSWMYDQLISCAVRFYQTIEKELNLSLFNSIPIYRTLFDNKDFNEWISRSGTPGYEEYMLDIEEADQVNLNFLRALYPMGKTQGAYQLSISKLLKNLRDEWIKNGSLKSETFVFDELQIQNNYIYYRDISCLHLVFCEGIGICENTYFNYLPTSRLVGESMIVNIPGAPEDRIIKRNLFLVPLGNSRFWIGSYNQKDFVPRNLPSEKGREYLVSGLRAVIAKDFEVQEFRMGVRATVKDRRPLVGTHPMFNNLHVVNGMGTKGASLAPFCADVMTDYLLSGIQLPKSIDIQRFADYWEPS